MKLNLSLLFLLSTAFTSIATNKHNASQRRLQSFDQPCRAILVDVNYDRDDPNIKEKEKMYLKCEVPGGKAYRVPSADFEFIKNNFLEGPYKSAQTMLNVGPDAKLDLDTVELILPDDEKPTLSDMADEHHSLFRKKRNLATTTGTFSVLAVRIVTTNGEPSSTGTEISDAIFGTSGDSVNLVSQYRACSHGKLLFEPATGNGVINGVITATLSLSNAAGEYNLLNDAIDVLTSTLGSSPSNVADYVMFCMPPDVMSGIAWAYIDYWVSVYSDNWCNYVSVQLHEVGHNLNMGHSGAYDDYYNYWDQYGDTSGMMGYSYSYSDWPKQCFNAAKMWQLGWFSARHKTLSSTGTTSYSGDIADITQDPNDSSGPPIVIKMDTPSSEDYFLSFNRATGFNSETYMGANEVRIVKTTMGSGTDYSETWLMASLSSGQSWTSDADFSSGQRVTVTVNSIGVRANVEICIGPCPTTTTAPTPTAPTPTAPTPTAPTPTAPTPTAPTPTAPTPNGCVDYSNRFALIKDGKRITRSCAWVANMSNSRCAYTGVSAACPVSCGTCSICVDADPVIRFRFLKDGSYIKRSCDWVSRKDTSWRCALVDDACRATCGAC